MDTTRRFQEAGNLYAVAQDSSLCRTVLQLFLLLAGTMFFSQTVVTAHAAPETSSTAAKRPLPSRVAAPDQKSLPVAEKQPVTDEPGQTAPAIQKVDASAPGVKKPLPVRGTVPDQQTHATPAAAVEKRLPADSDVHAAPSTAGEKRALPLRTLTPGQKLPATVTAGENKTSGADSAPLGATEQKAERPSSGEKRPLPLRTAPQDLTQPVSEADQPVLAEKKAEGLSSGGKRPLPLRAVARDPDVPVAVSAGAKKSADAESDTLVSGEQKAEGPSIGEKRPLPARSLSAEVKTSVTDKDNAKKPLVSEPQPATPAEIAVSGPSNGEKRPLPLRSVAQGQSESVATDPATVKTGTEADLTADGGTKPAAPLTELKRPLPARSVPPTAAALLEGKKPLDGEKRPSNPLERKSEAPASVDKRPLPIRQVLNDQKTIARATIEEKQPLEPEHRQPLPIARNVAAPESAVKRPLPVPAAMHEQKTAAVVKKPLVREQTSTAIAQQKQPAKAAEAPAGNWTILVGSYLLEQALATDKAKVKKAGLTGLVQQGDKKSATMIRLLLAEYGNRGEAQAALAKLKHHTADAFMLDHGGTHAVYAGSYLLESRAASEKERLGVLGFTLTPKRAEVAIPSKSLTAGRFSDKRTAEAALNKLSAAGIKATLVHQ